MYAKIKLWIFIIAGLYLVACVILYFFQEKLLFHPTKLSQDYTFNYDMPFEEINLNTVDGVSLNLLHFKSTDTKGAVLFLHGNGGSMADCAFSASLYLQNNYDVLYLDYRGYGKSGGSVSSEQQMIDDGQLAYDYLKQYFPENQIIVLGMSMGTGIATPLAVRNSPAKLVLNAPYFSLKSLIKEKVKIVPIAILKYKFDTAAHLEKVKCPVIIFHGDKDELIPIHHSFNLKAKYPDIQLHVLKNTAHNDLILNEKYEPVMNEILQ